MMGINKVILVGNLGGDPEIKKTASDQSITLFNLATSKSWVNREGQRQESTDWHRIVVWGKLGETCANYLSKGRQVYIEGRIQTRSWEDDKGQKRYTTEVIANQVLFLGSAQNAMEGVSQAAGKSREQSAPSYQNEPNFSGGAKESEIPF